jgi:hypothetical protein
VRLSPPKQLVSSSINEAGVLGPAWCVRGGAGDGLAAMIGCRLHGETASWRRMLGKRATFVQLSVHFAVSTAIRSSVARDGYFDELEYRITVAKGIALAVRAGTR